MTHVTMKDAAEELGLSISWTYRLLKKLNLRETLDGLLHIEKEALRHLIVDRGLRGKSEVVETPKYANLKRHYNNIVPSCPWR